MWVELNNELYNLDFYKNAKKSETKGLSEENQEKYNKEYDKIVSTQSNLLNPFIKERVTELNGHYQQYVKVSYFIELLSNDKPIIIEYDNEADRDKDYNKIKDI